MLIEKEDTAEAANWICVYFGRSDKAKVSCLMPTTVSC